MKRSFFLVVCVLLYWRWMEKVIFVLHFVFFNGALHGKGNMFLALDVSPYHLWRKRYSSSCFVLLSTNVERKGDDFLCLYMLHSTNYEGEGNAVLASYALKCQCWWKRKSFSCFSCSSTTTLMEKVMLCLLFMPFDSNRLIEQVTPLLIVRAFCWWIAGTLVVWVLCLVPAFLKSIQSKKSMIPASEPKQKEIL